VNFADERGYAEEAANRRLLAEETETDYCTDCGADFGQVRVGPSDSGLMGTVQRRDRCGYCAACCFCMDGGE
jgi:hypothetical protein